MAERTLGGYLPRWFPFVTAGIALLNLSGRDWLGATIWGICTVVFMLPEERAGRRWVLVARIGIAAVILVLLALRIRTDF